MLSGSLSKWYNQSMAMGDKKHDSIKQSSKKQVYHKSTTAKEIFSKQDKLETKKTILLNQLRQILGENKDPAVTFPEEVQDVPDPSTLSAQQLKILDLALKV